MENHQKNLLILTDDSNGLDFEEVRWNTLRVPEVQSYIIKAQKIYDQRGSKPIDFIHSFLSDDTLFFSKKKSFRNFLKALAQKGLFDHYVRSQGKNSIAGLFGSAGSVSFGLCSKTLSLQKALFQAMGPRASSSPDKLSFVFACPQEGIFKVNNLDSSTFSTALKEACEKLDCQDCISVGFSNDRSMDSFTNLKVQDISCLNPKMKDWTHLMSENFSHQIFH